MIFKKIWALTHTYVISQFYCNKTTTAFWYLRASANVTDADTLHCYLTPTKNAPHYLINYAAKLQYPYRNEEGIIVLFYADSIGCQINPEAAFQYALALHDAYLTTNAPEQFKQFLHYCDYFLRAQNAAGDWSYFFDWFESAAPWASSLAQARGISVMLRAWMHTKDEKYLHSARLAVSRFLVPVEQGGFLKKFEPADCFYFEEYPGSPTAVLNGFMVALLGIWELMAWDKQQSYDELWSMGITSLEKMLPYYTLEEWTLYDQSYAKNIKNYNSPFYHAVEIEYLKVLSMLSGSKIVQHFLQVRQQQVTRIAVGKAYLLKAYRKLVYR